MTTLNLSPKNPMFAVALAIGAWYVLTRRPVSASSVTPAPVGAGTINGTNTINTVVAAARALFGGGAIGSATAPAPATDPYYGGPDAIAGNSLNAWSQQIQSDAALWSYANGAAAAQYGGDPYGGG